MKCRRLISEGYTKQYARDNSHAHLNREQDAREIKEIILSNKRTKKRDIRTLCSYTRVAGKDYKHYNWVCGLYETKIDKLR